jgi:hypothetical protein
MVKITAVLCIFHIHYLIDIGLPGHPKWIGWAGIIITTSQTDTAPGHLTHMASAMMWIQFVHILPGLTC